MQTITFYSYKGGLGRTLVVANVARYLSLFGKKVFALDLDLEAPGLHYKLGLGGEGRRIERGFVDFIHSFLLEQGTPALRDYMVEVERRSPSEGSIHLLPAGAVPSAKYWQKLARISWHDLFYSENPKGIPFFLELKAEIAEEVSPDYLLIDARTGITEVGGVATSLLADTVVCLLLNNRENLEGAREVLRAIRRAPRLPGQAPVQIVPVVARLPELEDQSQEKRILEEVRTFLNEDAPDLASTLNIEEVLVLHVDPELQLREFLRVGGTQGPEESVLLRDYLRLFARLIPEEVIRVYLKPLIRQAVEKEAWDAEGARKDLEFLIQSSYNREICIELARFFRSRLDESGSDRQPLPDESLAAALPVKDPRRSGQASTQVVEVNSVNEYYSRGGCWVSDPARAAVSRVNARDLSSAGWGIIFPDGIDPAIREALRPLLRHRRVQAGHLYHEFTVKPGQDKSFFLDRYGAVPGLADPQRIPYYLLIVGDPEMISFDFQCQLDIQYGVGRICFDTPDEYAQYAHGVVVTESEGIGRDNQITLFGPSYPDDRVSATFLHKLLEPLSKNLEVLRDGWRVELVTAENASKTRLRELLTKGSKPALLFAASYGVYFPPGDPRRNDHGALLCSEWLGPSAEPRPIPSEWYFSASDVLDTAQIQGLVAFLYASHTAGTEQPEARKPGDSENTWEALTSRSFVARLPQRLLTHPSGGALAVIGKINSGWLTFLHNGGDSLIQSVIRLLIDGYPVGAAMEIFSQYSAELSAGLVQREGKTPLTGEEYQFLWRSIMEARSFIVLGDPAVRLAVDLTPA